MRIRNQVKVFGRFNGERASSAWVEVLINYLGEFAPEASDLDEIIDTGTKNSL
jgi:hypothetical protein